ncbi:hypothetical protein DBR32_15620 [Taibaiella sp. KBW10]|uniref:hypothetical protein n=1 Tax=Taibaiella sp. KBW10 TaxID=2153357 RepID=UPI000F5902F7|nr:hypothetical protein [Taibaiella sp. KBW10]RQO29684.1 hypothetical protein DBR32_15620 [Taibaiella sp. KBW10]
MNQTETILYEYEEFLKKLMVHILSIDRKIFHNPLKIFHSEAKDAIRRSLAIDRKNINYFIIKSKLAELTKIYEENIRSELENENDL